MSQPSPDAKAVVRAAEALTTQVRRIANALSATAVRYEVATDDDATTGDRRERGGHTSGHTTMNDLPSPPSLFMRTDDGSTTPAPTCSAQHHGHASGARDCIRPAQHHGDHIDEQGYHWSDTVAVYPTDSTVRVAHWHPVAEQLAGERQELAGLVGEFVDAQVRHDRAAEERRPCPYCGDRQMIPRRQFDEHVARLHPDARTSPADDEEPPSWERRKSLAVLLSRAQRGVTPLTSEESDLLRRHVETEIREANTARAVAAGNKRHVQAMYGDLQREEAASAGLAGQIKTQRAALDTAHRRAGDAERELRILRSGLRANGADPTQLQNLWAQISLRNRQWRETKRELRLTRSMLEEEGGDVSVVDEMVDTVAKAEAVARERGAVIERVRAECQAIAHQVYGQHDEDDDGKREAVGRVIAALDGTEQPTTEA